VEGKQILSCEAVGFVEDSHSELKLL